MGGDGGGDIGVEIYWCMGGVFDVDFGYYLFLEGGGCWCCVSEERFIVFVRGVVMLNKVVNVDLCLLCCIVKV